MVTKTLTELNVMDSHANRFSNIMLDGHSEKIYKENFTTDLNVINSKYNVG